MWMEVKTNSYEKDLVFLSAHSHMWMEVLHNKISFHTLDVSKCSLHMWMEALRNEGIEGTYCVSKCSLHMWMEATHNQ